jgi:hypothetical protein
MVSDKRYEVRDSELRPQETPSDKPKSGHSLVVTFYDYATLVAENRALHSQVRELEKAVDFHTCSQSCTQDELHAAQARITALEAECRWAMGKVLEANDGDHIITPDSDADRARAWLANHAVKS